MLRVPVLVVSVVVGFVVDVVVELVGVVVVEVDVVDVVLEVGAVVVDDVVELDVLSSPPLASAITAMTRPITTAATSPIIDLLAAAHAALVVVAVRSASAALPRPPPWPPPPALSASAAASAAAASAVSRAHDSRRIFIHARQSMRVAALSPREIARGMSDLRSADQATPSSA